MSTRKRLKESEYEILCDYRAKNKKRFVPKDKFKRCGQKSYKVRLSDDELELIQRIRSSGTITVTMDVIPNRKMDAKMNAFLEESTPESIISDCNSLGCKTESIKVEPNKNTKTRNVLVIGDLHAPFIKKGYLDFCKAMYIKYKCTDVVFIGDLLDNHFSSFHETDPDGMGGKEELRRGKEQIAEFYRAFPVAKVILGNHDILPNRKAFSGGLSSSWIKTIDEVLNVPNWTFAEEFVIDGVLYTHGIGRQARIRVMQELISVCQGHFHSKSYYETFTSERQFLFALQIGCGLDRKSYAAAYAKHFQKPQINVGVVLDNGRWGLIEHMKI